MAAGYGRGWVRVSAVVLAMGIAALQAGAAGPAALRVDNLKTPLGLDDGKPSFTWQLDDAARDAKQTAYEVQVATSEAALRAGKADVWDSGRVGGDASINVRYAGPALKASTRYWWRVTVWGANGKAYAASEPVWWETGLMADGWRAGWIGYETAEEAAVRHAPAEWIACPDSATPPKGEGETQRFAFRAVVTLAKPVKRAALYATGEDTVSAWVNGKQVMEARRFRRTSRCRGRSSCARM